MWWDISSKRRTLWCKKKTKTKQIKAKILDVNVDKIFISKLIETKNIFECKAFK